MEKQLSKSIFVKGLDTDTSPKRQSEGTYRYAKNAVVETTSGDHMYISNELGNSICGEVNKPIAGAGNMDNQEVFLALVPDEIGIFNTNTCTYTPLVVDDCFNFSLDHKVYIEFRIRNGCDRTVYLTDNYNSYRVINLDALPKPFSCNQIKYTKDYTTPTITLQSVTTGGTLKVGTYQFAIRYLDNSYNATNWVLISNSVPVNDDSMSAPFGMYDGGVNKVDNNTLIGEVVGNKKISLTFTNLDSNFVYYEVAILSYVSNTGTLTEVRKSSPISISQAAFNYTGNEPFDSIDIADVLVDDVSIDKVATHAQLDNRLYLGNVTEYSKDYSDYQIFASKITTEWVAEFSSNYDSHDNKSTSAPYNPKNEFYYFNGVGFQQDEIYALGIVYVHKNGTKSPVCHIPGRCISEFDNTTVAGGAANVNVFNTTKTKNWQVFNTATILESNVLGKRIRGRFGYYQTTTNYPVVNTCTNPEDYWGKDCDGTKLTGSPIRHHRFPAWDNVAPEVLTGCQAGDPILGAKFSNVTYPNTDIVGHYFVFGDRTNDFTVYDAVYLQNGVLEETNTVLPFKESLLVNSIPSAATDNHIVLSTKTWFDNQLERADYFRATKVFSKVVGEGGFGSGVDIKVPAFAAEIRVIAGRIMNFADQCNTPNIKLPTSFNYKILDTVTLEPLEDYATPPKQPLDTIYAKNYSTSNWASFLKTSRTIDYLSYRNSVAHNVWVYGYLKYDRDVFEDLSTIQYINNNNALSLNTIYSGDTFNTTVNFVEPHWEAAVGEDWNVSFWVASMFLSFQLKDNYAFRHGNKNDYKNSYYKFEPLALNPGEELEKYLAGKVFYTETGDLSGATPYVHDEVYLYNPDYSVCSSPERLSSLPIKFDFCNDCQGKHPYRIYYSQLDNQEGLEDNYLKILPLSYKDLDGSQGPITALRNNFNNLYALTTHTAYFIPTRPQQLGTNESTIYIGTGEVLSNPPRQLKVTNFEFGGTAYQSSVTPTEYGMFYVDNYSGTPFMITDKLESIASGLRNEWKNNGSLKLVDAITSIGGTYSHLLPISGVGYTSTYDPRHKRIIIHKRDYQPLVPIVPKPSKGELSYSGSKFFDWKDSPVEITDTKYFKDVSFTLSYSFLTNSWASYHSYFPDTSFNNYATFFTTYKDGKIYKHNSGNYQTYYGKKEDHVLEATLVDNPFMVKTFDSITYESETNLNDNYAETSFDRFIAYNDKQSTGLQTLTVANTFATNTSNTSALLKRKDKYWRINELRDTSINNSPAIIDNIPNASKTNPNKSLFNTERMRDYYLNCRFYFKPLENYKISTDLISVTSNPTNL